MKAKPSAKQLPKGRDMDDDKKSKESEEMDSPHKNNSMTKEEDVPTDNIRNYILKHYGINAEREKQRKEERVHTG
jgi:hypothetical protein